MVRDVINFSWLYERCTYSTPTLVGYSWWRHNTQHNDIKQIETHHYDSQHNDIQHNDIQHNNIERKDNQHKNK
jgi:hypothetical protein